MVDPLLADEGEMATLPAKVPRPIDWVGVLYSVSQSMYVLLAIAV